MARILSLGIFFGYFCLCFSVKKRLDFLELQVNRIAASTRSDIIELAAQFDALNETVMAGGGGGGGGGNANNPFIEAKLNALEIKFEQFMQDQREKAAALSKAITAEKAMSRKMLKIMKELADSNAESVLEIEKTLEQNEAERKNFLEDWQLFVEGMKGEVNALSEQTELLNDKLENFDGNIVIHGSGKQKACPENWLRDGDLCYLFEESEKLSWYGARIRCSDFDGKLAEPDTDTKMAFIMSNIHADNVWIGGTDEDEEGKWIWASSQKSIDSNINWQPDQPNNLYTNQHCMEIGLFAVNDESCFEDNYYICEKPVAK